MRPAEARQISMARSSAQSECEELSTGTKTSLYGMTPPSAVMGSQNDSELQGFSRAHDLHLPRQASVTARAPAPLASGGRGSPPRDMNRRETHVKGRVREMSLRAERRPGLLAGTAGRGTLWTPAFPQIDASFSTAADE